MIDADAGDAVKTNEPRCFDSDFAIDPHVILSDEDRRTEAQRAD